MKQNIGSKLRRILHILGPGLITGASDDDPSGIATYSQAGASFGLATLWTALITFPLMASIQEMCARIGIVTKQGLAGTLKKNYPKSIVYLVVLFNLPAIILNIGADIAGMGAVGNLLFPFISPLIFSIFFTSALMVLMIFLPYNSIFLILKYLCIVMFAYLIVPFLTKQDLPAILKATFVPTVHFNKDFIKILVAILGTTISPYLFFWQADLEVEDRKNHSPHLMVNKMVIKNMEMDVNLGMFFSNLIMYFMILTTGSVLFQGGMHRIDTIQQAATALRPLAGNAAYLLFALGVIGTGLLAIPVLSGSLSYMMTETFGWKKGLNKKFYQAKGFYMIMGLSLFLGLLLNLIGVSPIQALIYSAILYGLSAPVSIAVILHISNNKKIMGDKTNKSISNILGFTTLMLMTVSAVILVYMQFKS